MSPSKIVNIILSTDKSRGYTGFTSVTWPVLYVLNCMRDNSKMLSRVSFKLGTHVFGSGKGPYF